MTAVEHNALIDLLLAEAVELRVALRLKEREYRKAIELRDREHGPPRPESAPVIATPKPVKADPGLSVRVETTRARRRTK